MRVKVADFGLARDIYIETATIHQQAEIYHCQ